MVSKYVKNMALNLGGWDNVGIQTLVQYFDTIYFLV